MIHTQDAAKPHKCSIQSLEFKEKMYDAIEESGLLNKQIAYELGYEPADLSHWLSTRCESTMPSHLLPKFCAIVQNTIVMEYLDAVS